jgi:hypothetical protein
MDAYGAAAVALIGLAFYFLHRTSAFLVAGAAIVGAFTIATYRLPARELRFDWWLMTAGLVAWVVGFAIVRVMLVRSASLQLLARIDGARAGSFDDDISTRLQDMRVLCLVRRTGDGNTLTRLGAVVADIVAALYSAFRIKT